MTDASQSEELRASFREVLDDIAAAGDIRRHVDAGAARCEPLWRKAAGLGWFALLTPEEHGGLGLGRAAAAVLYEELGRVTAPLPILGALAATEILSAFGDEAQQALWAPRLAAGETATFSVEDLTPDWAGLCLKEDGLTGNANELLDGAEAALLLTPVRLAGGMRWALTETSRVAVQRGELVDRTRSLASARLDSVPAAVLPGAAEAIARTLRMHACFAIACDSVGGAKAVLELTVQYLMTREQFGKPIGSFQALKHRCAEHKVAIEAVDALLEEAVARWDRDDEEAELYALLAKSLACEAYASMATDAIQLHGGLGFTWEHNCHLYLKRAKLNQALLGGVAAPHDRAAQLLVV
ncbi:MAG: acyl-CoA dehydrogenase family protein [Hyphomonadaceae bacterium]